MRNKATKFAAVFAVVWLLSGCSNSDGKMDKPLEPAWIESVSPSGRAVECLWAGKYGGIASNSFQADLWCFEKVTND
jgi:hypothetical protein